MNLRSQKTSIVTVSHVDELPLLRVQAKSLDKYLDRNLVTAIYVIVNDNRGEKFQRYFNEHVLPAYGDLGPHVSLVPYANLWGGRIRNRRVGWISQQALKLLAAHIVADPHYLLLDTKNHFIRDVDAADFFAPNGKLKTHLYSIHPKFEDHYRRACRYFGLKGTPPMEDALPTTPPFVMDRETVLSLMKEIENREGRAFTSVFSDGWKFTEFYLYYAYILARRSGLSGLYEVRHNINATLFHAASDQPAKTRKIIARLQNENIKAMGVHRKNFDTQNQVFLEAIRDCWIRYDLIQSTEEFQEILSFYTQQARWHKKLAQKARLLW